MAKALQRTMATAGWRWIATPHWELQSSLELVGIVPRAILRESCTNFFRGNLEVAVGQRPNRVQRSDSYFGGVYFMLELRPASGFSLKIV